MSNPISSNPAALDFALRGYIGPTAPKENPEIAVANIAVQAVFRNDPNRLFWLVQNRSVNQMAIGFSAAVSLASGLILPPNGGTIIMKASEDGEVVTYPVFIVAGVDASTLYSLVIGRP